MKIYTSKRSSNSLTPRYTVITYDQETEELTYSERRVVPPAPASDHPIYELNPGYVYEAPEGSTNINGVDYYPAITTTINFKKLKLDWTWSERTTWLAATNEKSSRIVGPFNITKETMASRTRVKSWMGSRNLHILFLVHVPFVSGEDMSMMTFTVDDPRNVLILNGDLEHVELPGVDNPNHFNMFKESVFPNIITTAPSTISQNSSAEVTIELKDKSGQLLNRNATMYLEAVVGTTNKARVDIVNGTGKFVVSSTDLSVGDVVRVKIGWKLWPGESDVFITVVE